MKFEVIYPKEIINRGKNMKTLFFSLIAVFFLYSAGDVFAQDKKEFTYIGVDACAPCHKTEKQGKQLEIWKNSKHANAYNTLLTPEADKIAKDLGFETPAAKTENCLKCHASGYNVEPAKLGKKFKIEEGVQCETCHGPGSGYKDMKVMKDRQLSIENGLVIYEDLEKYCVTCHNSESPTYVARDMKEAWELIKHPVPQQK